MTVININNQDDKDYILEHIEIGEKLARKNAETLSLLVQYNAKILIRNNVGDRVKAGLVRQNPAAGSAIEAQLTDFAIELPGSGVMIIHTNDDASVFRNRE